MSSGLERELAELFAGDVRGVAVELERYRGSRWLVRVRRLQPPHVLVGEGRTLADAIDAARRL